MTRQSSRKNELKHENAELQSLCKELMNMVERGVGTSSRNDNS